MRVSVCVSVSVCTREGCREREGEGGREAWEDGCRLWRRGFRDQAGPAELCLSGKLVSTVES